MKKWLLLLLGLLLIALLTYFCFTSKQESIRQDLIANTKSALGTQGSAIEVGIKGKEFKTTRIITLKGVVPSKEEKAKAEELAKAVAGVAGVENLLVVQKPKVVAKPKVEAPKPKVVAKPIPSPYTISATKAKDGTIVLNGYVPNEEAHQKIVADTKALFGDDKVTDNLKVSKGAPTAWLETSELALNKLKDVDYGEFNISDSDFTFKGYIGSDKAKKELLSEFDSKLSSAYKGSYNIDAPAPIPSPYTISATKAKDGSIVLNGYVPNEEVHQKIVADAKALFGDDRVTDNLKVSKGAPTAWLETSELGLNKLKDVDYGEFNISDSDFTFKGYIGSDEAKKELLSELNSSLDSNYKGSYLIDAPEVKIEEPTVEENTTATVESQITNCKSQIDNLLSKEKIHFEYNKATIKQDSYDLLANLVDIINKCPDATVTIEGHTDSDGSAKYNKQLSQKRADAVKAYLENKGVAKERLKAVGYGESKPIASNATKEGKSKNRRIEFKFEGVKQ